MSEIGHEFMEVWDGHDKADWSRSEGDIALCGYLARFTSDARQIGRLFRCSPRLRPKWDALRGEHTYGQRTITTALCNAPGDASSSAFRPVDIGVLLTEVEDAVPWIVEGYLGRGLLTLLGGVPKVGKTTLAYDIAQAVAVSNPILDRATAHAKVLIVAAEEHRRDVVNRFRLSDVNFGGTIDIQLGALPFSHGVLTEMARYIRDHDIGLVVIDTIHSWWGVQDENASAKVLEAGKVLLQGVRASNAAWLVIVHSRKTGGEAGMDIRGSNALVGLADIALSLKRTNTSRRSLQAVTRYRETPRDLIVTYRHGVYEALGSKDDVERRQHIKALREHLSEWRTVDSLINLTGYSKREVNLCLEKLKGSLDRRGNGVKGDPFLFRLIPYLVTIHRGGGEPNRINLSRSGPSLEGEPKQKPIPQHGVKGYIAQ